MKKILTILSLAATSTLMGQSLVLSDADLAMLEKLKMSSPFSEMAIGSEGGIGSAQMLSLRGITKLGKYWYFSIYDISLNSCFWIKLKDDDKELALIKAVFFDDENKELEIKTDSYSHILALKDRDPLVGQVPNIAGSVNNNRGGRGNKGQQMQQMFSNMNSQQKGAMAMQLAASMMFDGQQNQNGRNNQNGKNNQNGQNSNNRNSSNGSNNRSSSGGNSSGRSSSGGNSSGGRR